MFPWMFYFLFFCFQSSLLFESTVTETELTIAAILCKGASYTFQVYRGNVCDAQKKELHATYTGYIRLPYCERRVTL